MPRVSGGVEERGARGEIGCGGVEHDKTIRLIVCGGVGCGKDPNDATICEQNPSRTRQPV